MVSGELLRMARNLRGINQEFMAKKLGISQPCYCMLEKRNEINGEKLQTLLVILNYTEKEIEEMKKYLPP